MEVGEVRVAEDADFEKLKGLCQCNDHWKQEYNKNGTTVWTKVNDTSDFKMVRVSVFSAFYYSACVCHMYFPLFANRHWANEYGISICTSM